MAVSSEFVTVMDAATHVLKVGDFVGTEARIVFLVIPGNPGIMDYYEEFMKTLHRCGDHKYPVWGISHAGHVSVPDSQADNSESEPFGLEDQILHKIEFIKRFIPKDVKIVFIGHSIGCYMILHILKELEAHQVMRCFLLFPTIERMAESPQGKIAAPMLKYLRWLGICIVKAISYLSHHVQYRLILWYFKDRDVPNCVFNASMNLFNPSVIDNMTFMADQEMRKVMDLDVPLVREHISKLSFYYGQEDHWCPPQYYYDMKKLLPHGDLTLCDKGYSHAFVLDASVEMGNVIWSWIQKDLHKLKD